MNARSLAAALCLTALCLLYVRPCDAATDVQRRNAERAREGVRAAQAATAERKRARAVVRAARGNPPAPITKGESETTQFPNATLAFLI